MAIPKIRKSALTPQSRVRLLRTTLFLGYSVFLWAVFVCFPGHGPLSITGSSSYSASLPTLQRIKNSLRTDSARELHPSIYENPQTAGKIAKDDDDRQTNMWKREMGKPSGSKLLKPPFVLDSWEPRYHCPYEERVGPQGDGGKWMCRVRDYTGPGCVVYSFGCRGDIRYERDLARLTKCTIHIFDPDPRVVEFARTTPVETEATSTLDSIENTVETLAFPRGSHFHPWAFYEPQNALSASMVQKLFPGVVGGNLRWIVENLGTVVPQIIKMDIESSELLIDFRADADTWKQVHMFLVEVHLTEIDVWTQANLNITDGDTPHWSYLKEWIATLEGMGFRLFHKEQNPFYISSKLWELAFVNLAFF